uniref:uncharacterized protein LOC124066271 n=1 Tax=Scatophagus argus TaxID=75038 RepID=UPI001ED802C5|nr:uncharacterized protein LOC124066271 [Scatophagus argus]
MTSVEKRRSGRKSGGHRKHSDGGYSDTSSGGSFLDETDREVSSLTDRAFRSLCIGDEAVYNDSDLCSSSPCSQRDRQLAFSQSVQDRDREDREREELKRAAHESFSLRMQHYGQDWMHGGMYGAKIHRDPQWQVYGERTQGRVSATFQHSFVETSQQGESLREEQLSFLSNGATELSSQQRRSRSRVSSLIRAFNSEGNRDGAGMDEFPKWYETSMYRELSLEAQSQVPYRFEERGIRPPRNDLVPVAPPTPSRSNSTSTMLQKALAVEKRCESELVGHYPHRKRTQSLGTNRLPSQRPSTASPTTEMSRRVQDTISSVKALQQKIKMMTEENITTGMTENHQAVHCSNNNLIPYGNKTVVPNVVSSNTTTTPFSISQLLTPLVSAHLEAETSEVPQYAVSPQPVEHPPVRAESRGATPDIRMSSYKARATSLLFNLKDNRKRVKSTYSPTKFKGLDTIEKNKQLSIREPRDTVIDIPDFPDPDIQFSQVEESSRTNAVSHQYLNQYNSSGLSLATLNSQPATAHTGQYLEYTSSDYQAAHRQVANQVEHRQFVEVKAEQARAEHIKAQHAQAELAQAQHWAQVEQSKEQQRRAAQEEQQRRAAQEELQRRAAQEEEQQRRAAQEEQKRRAAQEELQRRAAQEKQQRRAAQEEQQRRAAQEELQRRAAQEELQRRAALEEKQKRVVQEEEQLRKAAQEEQQRRAAQVQQQRRGVQEEKQRTAAMIEEQQRRAALIEEQQRRASKIEEQRRAKKSEEKIQVDNDEEKTSKQRLEEKNAQFSEEERIKQTQEHKKAEHQTEEQGERQSREEWMRTHRGEEERRAVQKEKTLLKQKVEKQGIEETTGLLEESQATLKEEKHVTQEQMIAQRENEIRSKKREDEELAANREKEIAAQIEEKKKAAQGMDALQYYAITSTESKRRPRERQLSSPLPSQRRYNPSGLESAEESYTRPYRPQAPASPAPSLPRSNTSSPALGTKPIMFKVKDNTIRGSSFTKSVKPRFHKNFGEDLQVGSSIGSERGEVEQESMKHSAVSPFHHDIGVSRLAAIKESSTFQPASTSQDYSVPLSHHRPYSRRSIALDDDSRSVISNMSEDVESFATSATDLADVRGLYDYERPESACSFSSDVSRSLGKPPAVPPKSEKALRRAKRLTTRRIKKELSKAVEDSPTGIEKPLQEVSSIPSSSSSEVCSSNRNAMASPHFSPPVSLAHAPRLESSLASSHTEHQCSHSSFYASPHATGPISLPAASPHATLPVSLPVASPHTSGPASHFAASKTIADVPSSPTLYHANHPAPVTQYHVESSYPQSYPLTQRKVLQDLGSGQYFVVDVPVQVKTKTFFDPDTGKYVQLNVRESAKSTSQPRPQPQQTYLQPHLQPQIRVKPQQKSLSQDTPAGKPLALYQAYHGYPQSHKPAGINSVPPNRSSAPVTLHQDQQPVRESHSYEYPACEMGQNSEGHHFSPEKTPYMDTVNDKDKTYNTVYSTPGSYESFPECDTNSQLAGSSVCESDNSAHSRYQPRDIITMSELEDFMEMSDW